MDHSCKYCQAPVTYDTIVCPKCGSRLIDMEETRRWWPYVAACLGLIGLGIGAYMLLGYGHEVSSREPALTVTKDRSAVLLAEEDERTRLLQEAEQRTRQQQLQKAKAQQQELASWNAMSSEEKSQLLAKALAEVEPRLDKAATRASGASKESLVTARNALNTAKTMAAAGSLDLAFDSLRLAREWVENVEEAQAPPKNAPTIAPAAEKPTAPQP